MLWLYVLTICSFILVAGVVTNAQIKKHHLKKQLEMQQKILNLLPEKGRMTLEGLWFEFIAPKPFTIEVENKDYLRASFVDALHALVAQKKVIEYDPYNHCLEYERALEVFNPIQTTLH